MSTRDRLEANAEGLGSSTVRRFRRTVALGAASTAVIAFAGLIGYALGIRTLGSIRPQFIPMAPSTAICFLILSGVLLGQYRNRRMGAGRTTMAALAFLVVLFGLLEIIGDFAGLDLTSEDRWTSGSGMLGDIPLWRMSPATAFAFALAGLGTLLWCLRAWNVRRESRLGHAAASLGLLTALLGATVLLGYVFGTPLMYSGSTVPMAATSAVAFLFLGTALAAAAGPKSFPNRLVVGDSLAAVLSRDFLVLTASALLIQGVLVQWVSHFTNGTDALLISALIIVTCAITAALAASVSHRSVARLEESTRTLSASEEKFRNLFNNAQVAMFRTRLDGSEMLDLNDPYLRILGYTREEVVGRPSEIVWANLRERAEMMRQLEADGFVTDLEFDLVNRDGEVRRCVTSLRLYRDEGILEGSLQDITDRRQAEESLRQSELRLRDITSSIGDWVWEVDEHRVYTYSSAKGAEWFGDVIGQTPFDFMPPEEAARVAAISADIAAAKAPIRDLEYWNLTKDGDAICLLTNGVPILGEDGQLKGYRGVDRDITDRKRADQERARLAAQLLQAQKMETVGRLAGGVAHDFNNMLGVILGNAELAMGQLEPAHPMLAELEEIRSAATRSAGLTRQLLAFARKQTIAPTVLNLNDTVSGMLRMLQRLIGEDIDLRWIQAPDLWPVKIDPSQIDQILANLCVNARDAITGTGELTIETSHRRFTRADCVNYPESVPGEYVMLGVSDNGVGMDAETVSHLFEPFFTTKEVGKGTGLGLATVYGIVRQNGGFIDVASELSHGTSFRIYLPRHVGRSELTPLEGPPAAVRHGHETILLVEDEPGILSLAAKMLERQGYTVLRAATPGEAIRLAQEHAGELHLLLTDVIMPEMNGHDLARNVLSLYPHIRRMFMSGHTADVIAHQGVLQAGVHFINKPFTQDELIRKVREAMGCDVGGG